MLIPFCVELKGAAIYTLDELTLSMVIFRSWPDCIWNSALICASSGQSAKCGSPLSNDELKAKKKAASDAVAD